MAITVRIVQLGKGIVTRDFESGTTLAAALAAAGVSTDRMDVRVRGRAVEPDQPLTDGDLITVIPRVRGGTNPAQQQRKRGPIR